MARKKTTKPKITPVDSIRHTKETRTGIPTEELRGFVADDETTPKTMLYPRDPSLDPQLVWKGKDEQDQADLAVPVVPVYIQEKIHPHALIDDFLVSARTAPAEEQLTFFGDFNGGPADLDKKLDFYHYQQNWSNRMILGDSLLVMTSLAEKEGLKGKVQTIYLDPPYGIKFGSNWQVSTRKRDVKDGKVEDATRQPEQIRAFRDTWKLGIHSYLAWLRDLLVAARELLTESGSVFVQIGDENVHLVRSLLDQVFGSENFCSQITLNKAAGQSSEILASVNDHLIWYARSKNAVKTRKLFTTKPAIENPSFRYICVETPKGEVIDLSYAQKTGEAEMPKGEILRLVILHSQTGSENSRFPYRFGGAVFTPPGARGWSTNLEGLKKVEMSKRMFAFGKNLNYKRYHQDFPYREINNLWNDIRSGGFQDEKVYVVQTQAGVIERCLLMTTDPGDLVLDPTCGSGTTAYVAEQWGRRWITIDTSRVALALARIRLMAAKFPYYLLADSPEGIKKEQELTGKTAPPYATEGDIRKGFVYKRVPHVTLKSIANNPDIKEGMTRAEIDAAIARHADQETLFDQPYEDKSRIRVTGPFTVESLSPHRVLPTADENLDGRVSPPETERRGDFATMILDNLRKAGVQNTVKNERLNFLRLDPHPSPWIQATGEYADADGTLKRVAVSIGPEFGTVGPDHVKEAAKEAVKGLGHDLLVVCGFAFDPHVAEESKNYGKLPVLVTRMNPDLAMGDELLKKTGAGNLFMVFGEPDCTIDPTPDGRITVAIHGVDVYDPTTGQIRNSSTDDIACWFLDTNYDGESFFVRHAYFCGAGEPYDKLKRALRAEVDESAWSALYTTTSRPFPKPKTGKLAIKVINHYGDEVLKVFPV